MFLILVVVVLFGYKRLPDVARSVGQSMKIFKGEMKSLKEDDAPANPVAPAAPDANLQAAAPNTVVQNATTQNGTTPGGSVADATPSAPTAPAAPPAGPTTPSA
nr:Sec-independent protein translocase subunit TatA [Cellulomonas sp. JH27-2]